MKQRDIEQSDLELQRRTKRVSPGKYQLYSNDTSNSEAAEAKQKVNRILPGRSSMTERSLVTPENCLQEERDAGDTGEKTYSEVKRRWKVGEVIGSGNFGQTRIAHDLVSGALVAVKLESAGNKKSGHLAEEYKIFRTLQGGKGIPEILYFGQCTSEYNAMVVELLGPSLKALLENCGGTFSVQTVAMLAVQLLERFEFIHSKGVVHRDVKPDNFLIGKNEKRKTVNVIDFGLAKFYVDPLTNIHIPYTSTKSVTGTVRYMSLNSHRGIQQSRRDDLEAMGYMFVFLLKGNLPWQGVKAPNNKVRYEKILEIKNSTSLDELTKGLPHEFRDYIDYTRQLGFFTTPNYAYLQKMFLELLRQLGVVDMRSFRFDWEEDTKGPGGDGPSVGALPRYEGILSEMFPRRAGKALILNEVDLEEVKGQGQILSKPPQSWSQIPTNQSLCNTSMKRSSLRWCWCCIQPFCDKNDRRWSY